MRYCAVLLMCLVVTGKSEGQDKTEENVLQKPEEADQQENSTDHAKQARSYRKVACSWLEGVGVVYFNNGVSPKEVLQRVMWKLSCNELVLEFLIITPLTTNFNIQTYLLVNLLVCERIFEITSKTVEL